MINLGKSLSKVEQKKIVGGYALQCYDSGWTCTYYESGTGNVDGTCESNSKNQCVCKGPNSSIVTSACNQK